MKQNKVDLSCKLKRDNLNYVLTIMAEKKLCFSDVLNLIIDERVNWELTKLLQRAE